MKLIKGNNLTEQTATDTELYATLKNDPARYVSIMTGRYDGTPMPKDFPRKIVRAQPKKQKPASTGRAPGPVIRVASSPDPEAERHEYILNMFDRAIQEGLVPKGTPFEKFEKNFHTFELDFDLTQKKKELDAMRLSNALAKIHDTMTGIGFVPARKKLNEGGSSDDPEKPKPIRLQDYLELGLGLANLTEIERKLVEDLIKKTLYPKK